LRYDYFGFLCLHTALKFHYTWVHLTSLSSILGVPYNRDNHTITQKILQWQNFFFNGGVNVEIKFYIFKSFGPHGGGELSYQHMIAQLVYQRHYLGNFGPITLTLCCSTEGRTLQHFIWKFYNFLQEL